VRAPSPPTGRPGPRSDADADRGPAATPAGERLPGWGIGRLLGIRVAIRPSTLVTAGILGVALYLQLAPDATRLSATAAGVLAVATTLGFFASIVAHELAHATLARSLGLPVAGVTVFYLGGVTQLGREPDDPRDELAIAVAGPLANLSLGAILILAAEALAGVTVGSVALRFLGEINAAIGAFNLLPGHPLDGGAILRAGLWRLLGDRLRAARVTARLGQGLAYLLIGAGVVGMLRLEEGRGDPGLVWLAVVGLFILTAARAGLVQTEVRQRLAGVTVADVLRSSPWTGEIGWTVARVVADVVRSQADGLVLDTGGRAVGTFGPDELAEVPSGVWDHLTLGETMRAVRGSVDGELPLAEVLPRFQGDPEAVLTVTDGGRPVGVLTAADVIARARGRRG
jgi:Zn-dependent protease